jgi:hypothetical protein
MAKKIILSCRLCVGVAAQTVGDRKANRLRRALRFAGDIEAVTEPASVPTGLCPVFRLLRGENSPLAALPPCVVGHA